MKNLLFLLLCFLICPKAFSDTFYLKNGSIIKGIIIEEISQESYNIQTPDGSYIICNITDIERIIKDKDNSILNNDLKYPKGNIKYKGSIGNTFGFGSFFVNNLFINNGVQFNNSLFLGLGVGFIVAKEYSYDDIDFCFPIYLVGSWDAHSFLGKKWAPFVSLNVGYNAPYAQIVKAEVGYHYKVENKYGIGAGIGLINLGGFVGASLTLTFDW